MTFVFNFIDASCNSNCAWNKINFRFIFRMVVIGGNREPLEVMKATHIINVTIGAEQIRKSVITGLTTVFVSLMGIGAVMIIVVVVVGLLVTLFGVVVKVVITVIPRFPQLLLFLEQQFPPLF